MQRWKKITYFVILGLILSYMVMVVAFVLPSRRNDVCKSVEVVITDGSKNRFVSEQDVVYFLKHHNLYPIGVPFSDISMRNIESQLMDNAALRRAECYQTSNGTLLVKVSQRVPVFRVMSGSSSYYVDNEQKIMPTVLRHSAYVPVVSGHVGCDFACNELYDFMVYLQDNAFLRSQFSQIYVYANNDVELIPRVGSQSIYVGSLDNYESKLKKLLVFYDKAYLKVGWDTYSRIDLQYQNQVVCVRREGN